MIFINCLIENPTFSSQTKDYHVTKAQKFGSTAKLSEENIKKIEKLGITANVIEIAKAKENKANLAKNQKNHLGPKSLP